MGTWIFFSIITCISVKEFNFFMLKILYPVVYKITSTYSNI